MDPQDAACLVQEVGATIGEKLNEGLAAQARELARSIARENQVSQLTTKPKPFSGKFEDWPVWSERFTATLRRMGYEAFLHQAEQEGVDYLKLNDVTPAVKSAAQFICDLLVDTLEGRSMSFMKRREKGNGFETWVRLKIEYEGKQAGRFKAMLTSILNAAWCDEKGNWLDKI